MPSVSLLWILCFLAFSVPAATGQERIEESRKKILYGGQLIQLSERSVDIRRKLGNPTREIARTLWQYPGMALAFDRLGRLGAIELAAPFRGATEMRYQVGTPIKKAAAADPKLKNWRQGWNQGRRIFVFVAGKVVTKIRIGQAPQGWRPRPVPQQTKKPTRHPATRLPKKRPAKGPTTKTPLKRPPPQSPRQKPNNLRPVPGQKPTPRAVQPARSNPQAKKIVVWEKQWRAQRKLRWYNAPANNWPTNEGLLLVRVAFGPRIERCEQLFCDYDLAKTAARDYIYRPDIVLKKQRVGTPLRWQWRVKGQGQAKVKIIWFKTKNHLKRYQRNNPYASNFAFNPPQKPWRKQVNLIWEHTWTATGAERFIRGPKEAWPDHSGVLLLRALGGPGVTSFLYRAGIRSAVELPLGDHTLPVGILDRAKKNNLFGGLFGNDRKKLHFAFRGRGPVKVLLYWLPEERFVRSYSREFPIASLNPWRRTAKIDPFAWVFGGPTNWRNNTDFESDWSRPLGPITGQVTNVASRANGALVRRSSRDRRLSRGSEFDGGLWYSARQGYAFSESRFSGHAHLVRLELGTAGSDQDAAHYIQVELERDDGTWERVATFRNENINWYRLTGNRRAVSRPSITIPLDSNVSYRALRILFSGHGPFRLAGVRAIGNFHGDRNYDDLPDLVAPARLVEVRASGGWTDTRGDIIAGRSILVDIEGTWSIDPTEGNQFGWSGPEGIAALALRGFFGSRAAHDSYRNRLPAPNLPAGSLIARIGLDGRPMLVTPGRPIIFDQSGRLYLGINDDAYADNRGSLRCTILGALFRQPIDPGPTIDLLEIHCVGQVRSISLRRPVPGVDVFLQLATWPRTIFGGTRTDGEGRFDFTVLVPRGQAVLIGVPEFKVESVPKSYQGGAEFRFDIDLN